MLVPNTDPLAIVMPVNVAEAAVYALQSFADSCGIPMDDDSERVPAAIRALQTALAARSLITIGSAL